MTDDAFLLNVDGIQYRREEGNLVDAEDWIKNVTGDKGKITWNERKRGGELISSMGVGANVVKKFREEARVRKYSATLFSVRMEKIEVLFDYQSWDRDETGDIKFKYEEDNFVMQLDGKSGVVRFASREKERLSNIGEDQMKEYVFKAIFRGME